MDMPGRPASEMGSGQPGFFPFTQAYKMFDSILQRGQTHTFHFGIKNILPPKSNVSFTLFMVNIKDIQS